jgi:hypothetical protein
VDIYPGADAFIRGENRILPCSDHEQACSVPAFDHQKHSGINMNIEKIADFVSKNATGKDRFIRIDFKNRAAVYAHFITESRDYQDLSSKNFWRVVTDKQFESYAQSKSLNFARIYHGSDFTKLSMKSVEVKG